MIEFNDRDRTVLLMTKNIVTFYMKPQRQPARWEIQEAEESGRTPETPTFDIDIDMYRGDGILLHYNSAEERQADFDRLLNTVRNLS